MCVCVCVIVQQRGENRSHHKKSQLKFLWNYCMWREEHGNEATYALFTVCLVWGGGGGGAVNKGGSGTHVPGLSAWREQFCSNQASTVRQSSSWLPVETVLLYESNNCCRIRLYCTTHTE